MPEVLTTHLKQSKSGGDPVVGPRKPAQTNQTRRAPAKTPEAQEQRLIALTVDLAEKQLRDGTASSQVMTHFLKLATVRENLERQKLEYENELLKVRAETMASASRSDDIAAKALEAMRSYTGIDDGDHYVD